MAKFVPRQRKHKVLARERAQDNARHEVADTNAEILPARDQDREQKKALLKAELGQDAGVKVSGKKAKRLEKYIDNKLRKDENRQLLAKLAERRIDTSLFSSSRALGQGRETKKQALSRALREHRAGLDAAGTEEILFERRRDVSDDDGDSGDEEVEDAEPAAKPEPEPEPEPVEPAAARPDPAVGSGLKRPLEVDGEGRPVIQKRRKRGGVEKKTVAVPQVDHSEESDDSEDEWNGFSGDDDKTQPDDDDDDDDSISEKNNNDEEESDSDDNSDNDDDDDDDDDSSDPGEEDGSDDGEQKASRSSAFKAWAHQQRNEALGFQPTGVGAPLLEIPKPDNFVPRAPEQDPLPMELQLAENTTRKVFSVPVTRTPEIQAVRIKLPVVSEEQRVMEAIHLYDIVFICGSTGSGKTTQIPQFLYEAGYGSRDSPTPGMIGITQPRRVAAVSMSKRVAEELGDHSGVVAYQIRFEGTVDDKTAIKFMTDGVLLREVAQDIALRKYSVIIIDEAHERSVNTDILIGMVSRVIKLRAELAAEDPAIKPLKLIIMSATLRVEELTSNPNLYANPPPTIDIEGRQHPVTMHFSRRTHHDYVEEAFRKISRGHKKLPPGGFLVFLTGRNEILELSKKLKAAFGGPRAVEGPRVQISANDAAVEVEDLELGDHDDRFADHDDLDGIPSDDEAEQEEDEFKIEDGEEQEVMPLKMQVLPLYSLLPVREQMRVFEDPPAGTRQIILATNVAETSLTIPGIRFVFDSGRSKERIYDRRSGVQRYEIGWISKASAMQRSGRAGRTGPGHCYRLYSSAVYERDFAEFQDPEMLRMPIEGVVLQLKAMNLQHVVNFPFPTAPDPRSLVNAEKMLTYLSAISPTGQITKIGTTMSRFPLAPRFSRILLVGHLHDCLPYTIALVAGLSAADVFLHENQAIPALAAKEEEEEEDDKAAAAFAAIRSAADVLAENRQAAARRAFNQVHKNFCFLDDRSDAIKLLQVVGEFAHDPTEQWCQSHFVRFKVLHEVQQLRRQITDLLRTTIASCAALQHRERLDAPSPKQVSALKQMAAAGFVDQVAIRADLAPNPPEALRKPRRAIDVPYVPLTPLSAAGDDPCVYIHPTSPLARLSPQECPEYVVYAYLQTAAAATTTTTTTTTKKPKTRMHAITDVTGGQLAGLARGTPLLTYGKPIKEVKAQTVVDGVVVRECWVIPYLRAENTAGQGWPLPAQRVKQKKLAGKWVIE